MTIHKIGAGELPGAAPRPPVESAAPSPPEPPEDKLFVSPWFRELYGILKGPEAPSREARVSALREQVAEGKYSPAPEEVARRFLGR